MSSITRSEGLGHDRRDAGRVVAPAAEKLTLKELACRRAFGLAGNLRIREIGILGHVLLGADDGAPRRHIGIDIDRYDIASPQSAADGYRNGIDQRPIEEPAIGIADRFENARQRIRGPHGVHETASR
jgi:hypothetical protein